jgi:Beta/Gamma crystallin
MGLIIPEIVVYKDINFGGDNWRTNLGWGYVGDYWNDSISSIIVCSGTWRFFEHAGFGGVFKDLTPGYYNWVEDVGIVNDTISSFEIISFFPNGF